jgi:hypothetical protein
MQLIAPIRPPTDFVNGQRAVLEWVEELDALAQPKTSDIDLVPEGFVLRLPSTRICEWLSAHGPFTPHLLLKSAKLDRFGSTLSVGQQAKTSTSRLYLGLTSWRGQFEMARRLRTQYIGPTFGEDSVTATEQFIVTITEALQLSERPSNSRQLPNWYVTKWGATLRVDPPSIERTLDYLLLDCPSPGDEPSVTELGAKVFALVARSASAEEPLRISISDQWSLDLATKDLARWLRGFEPKAKSDNNNLLPA